MSKTIRVKVIETKEDIDKIIDFLANNTIANAKASVIGKTYVNMTWSSAYNISKLKSEVRKYFPNTKFSFKKLKN